MEMVNNYLRQFVVWATGLQERYASDLFFRTSANIVALQALFVLVCIAAFGIALQWASQQWYAFAAVLCIAVLFGFVLARLTLKPARDTLENQKLFISNVAHELRTPLSTIKTSSEVALLDDKLPTHLKSTFNEIVEELNRVSEIINNLLSLNSLTRPERIQFQNIDIAPLAELVLQKLRPLSRERSIKVITRKEPGCIVWGNAPALEQVMTNLIKNALSYTPEKSNGVVTVTMRPTAEDMVLFSVADSGIGMSQEDLFHIFEPFYRADMSRVRKIQKSGSGLGLTIVNEMVRVHHGKINIQSARRRGTTVTVLLPRGGWSAAATKEDGHGEAAFDFSSSRSLQRATR